MRHPNTPTVKLEAGALFPWAAQAKKTILYIIPTTGTCFPAAWHKPRAVTGLSHDSPASYLLSFRSGSGACRNMITCTLFSTLKKSPNPVHSSLLLARESQSQVRHKGKGILFATYYFCQGGGSGSTQHRIIIAHCTYHFDVAQQPRVAPPGLVCSNQTLFLCRRLASRVVVGPTLQHYRRVWDLGNQHPTFDRWSKPHLPFFAVFLAGCGVLWLSPRCQFSPLDPLFTRRRLRARPFLWPDF